MVRSSASGVLPSTAKEVAENKKGSSEPPSFPDIFPQIFAHARIDVPLRSKVNKCGKSQAVLRVSWKQAGAAFTLGVVRVSGEQPRKPRWRLSLCRFVEFFAELNTKKPKKPYRSVEYGGGSSHQRSRLRHVRSLFCGKIQGNSSTSGLETIIVPAFVLEIQ
jgi:hypothetical protein